MKFPWRRKEKKPDCRPRAEGSKGIALRNLRAVRRSWRAQPCGSQPGTRAGQ